MKVSSKGRYALASMILLAQNMKSDSPYTVIGVSKRLGISKIYLEQIFALLRRGGLVSSTKGPQGGYQLARSPRDIIAADILSVTENSIFEETQNTVEDVEPGIERALQNLLFRPANQAFKKIFARMTLADLSEEAIRKSADNDFVYCI